MQCKRRIQNHGARENETKNATSVEQRHRESFFAQVKREIKGRYRFVRHPLTYFESVGDLLPGELARDDVVDTVLLRGYPEFVKEPCERDIGALVERACDKASPLGSDPIEDGTEPECPSARRYSRDATRRSGLDPR